MSEKKIPEPFEALLIILSSFFIILLFILFISGIMEVIFPQEEPGENIHLFYIISGIIFFILPFFYAKKKDYNLKIVFRLNPVNKKVTILTFIIAVTLSIIVDELDRIIQIFIQIPDWFTYQLQYLIAKTPLDWIIIIFVVIIIASFSEEFLFRGFLQVALEKKGDANMAVILSSVAWTVIHFNPYWAIQIFIMGVIIGFLAWRTNSIIPAIIVHATNNFISLIFLNFNLSKHMNWYLLGNHVSPVLLVICAFLLVWSIRKLTDLYRAEEQSNNI